MALSFFDDTVQVTRPGARDERGSSVPDWGNAETFELAGVLVTPDSTSQDRDGRAGQSTGRMTLRAAYDADVREGDRVRWRDGDYEVDGEVFHTTSPTGRASSTRCALVRWRG